VKRARSSPTPRRTHYPVRGQGLRGQTFVALDFVKEIWRSTTKEPYVDEELLKLLRALRDWHLNLLGVDCPEHTRIKLLGDESNKLAVHKLEMKKKGGGECKGAFDALVAR
jgi:hypothetical protein